MYVRTTNPYIHVHHTYSMEQHLLQPILFPTAHEVCIHRRRTIYRFHYELIYGVSVSNVSCIVSNFEILIVLQIYKEWRVNSALKNIAQLSSKF